jgi:hypothetical protein
MNGKLAKGAMVVGTTLAVFGSPESISPPAAHVEPSTVGICAVDSAVVLSPADCEGLPPLPTRAEFAAKADDETTRFVGSVILRNGDPLVSSRTLNNRHLEAVQAACSDPYILIELKRNAPTGINILATNHNENGSSDRETEVTELIFTEAGKRGRTLYETQGAVRAVLVHELTHDREADWAANGDETTKSLLSEFAQLYKTELIGQAEWMRLEQGPAIIEKLQEFKTTLEASGIGSSFKQDLSEAADKTIRQLQTPGGGAELVVGTDSDGTHLRALGDGHIGSILDLNGNHLTELDTAAFQQAEKLYDEFFEKAYDGVNESMILDGMVGDEAGHSEDNARETIATLVTDTYMNPAALVQAIRSLEPGRAAIKLRQLHILHELYKRNDPESEKLLPFNWVISELEKSA